MPIGEFRPWPDSVNVMRGETDEMRIYVPVVRCKDCRWYEDGTCYQPDGNGGLLCWEREPDGFCAWGEKKDGE